MTNFCETITTAIKALGRGTSSVRLHVRSRRRGQPLGSEKEKEQREEQASPISDAQNKASSLTAETAETAETRTTAIPVTVSPPQSPSPYPSTSLSSSPSSSPSTAATTIPTASTPRPYETTPETPIDPFLREAKDLLLRPLEGDSLDLFVSRLMDQFRDRLITNPACMLPSYNHQVPNGHECGRFLSLDVGGSTLRVALIELRGQQVLPDEMMSILSVQSFKITPDIKRLEGMAFFDWIAKRIIETIDQVPGARATKDAPLFMGLAWSFPIDGLLQGMGKGFLASDSLLGQDLGDIIQTACAAHGLPVQLAAILNDSSATLLSGAYSRTSTRFGLILGTGVNLAVHLPVPKVGRSKYGNRPAAWFEEASHVLINSELGMFGHGILPVTRWDRQLNAGHPKPEFQPLEHFVSGYYLGEVCRLILVEAVSVADLFGGIVPPSLLVPYALDTETLSKIEEDPSPSLESATATFHQFHPLHDGSAPSLKDMTTVRTLASLVSRRSAAIVAAAVYALWKIKLEAETEYLTDARHAAAAEAELAIMRHHTTVVAFNGSVIERYPRYLEQCQAFINHLLALGSAKDDLPVGTIELVSAKESSLIGAAVSLACLQA